MELSVFNRLILLNILPKEGDFTTLKIVRKLREDLSFSEEEHAALKFIHSGQEYIDESGKKQTVPAGQVIWNRGADIPKDIPIGEKASDIIADVLKKLDKEKKLQDQHYALYELFVEKTT